MAWGYDWGTGMWVDHLIAVKDGDEGFKRSRAVGRACERLHSLGGKLSTCVFEAIKTVGQQL